MSSDRRHSEGATVSSASYASASESGAPAEERPQQPDERSSAPHQQPETQAAVSAGEAETLEAPVAPPAEHEQQREEANGSADHEAKLERDLEELAAKAQKADQYLELAQRTKADFENYRKRATREAAAARDRGIAKLALELLPAVDNLDRALQAAGDPGDGDHLASGVKLVHADLIAALARVGIEPFSPEGEPFDPQRHEAVAQQPVDGAQPGTIVEVYQRGYCLGDAVLRPARVVVAG
jgi:molecular chaperone GrpE